MLWIILIDVCICVELLLLLMHIKDKKGRRKKAVKSLYKLIEERVLDHTLRERITSEQAVAEECQLPFLCVEFPDTRPLLMHIFSLDECVTVGRSRENKICIRDDMLSRLHCKISMVNGSLILKDMMTVNGTRIHRNILKREKLMPGQETFIYPGDVICMGNYRMRIHIYYGWEMNT